MDNESEKTITPVCKCSCSGFFDLQSLAHGLYLQQSDAWRCEDAALKLTIDHSKQPLGQGQCDPRVLGWRKGDALMTVGYSLRSNSQQMADRARLHDRRLKYSFIWTMSDFIQRYQKICSFDWQKIKLVLSYNLKGRGIFSGVEELTTDTYFSKFLK